MTTAMAQVYLQTHNNQQPDHYLEIDGGAQIQHNNNNKPVINVLLIVVLAVKKRGTPKLNNKPIMDLSELEGLALELADDDELGLTADESCCCIHAVHHRLHNNPR